jgi:hypothetical protein
MSRLRDWWIGNVEFRSMMEFDFSTAFCTFFWWWILAVIFIGSFSKFKGILRGDPGLILNDSSDPQPFKVPSKNSRQKNSNRKTHFNPSPPHPNPIQKSSQKGKHSICEKVNPHKYSLIHAEKKYSKSYNNFFYHSSYFMKLFRLFFWEWMCCLSRSWIFGVLCIFFVFWWWFFFGGVCWILEVFLFLRR